MLLNHTLALSLDLNGLGQTQQSVLRSATAKH
jgi:hypothetical protein